MGKFRQLLYDPRVLKALGVSAGVGTVVGILVRYHS
jgi:ElaB/YqjD/DUF883 family membrane-anchored ribosome-binding protein